VAELIQEKKDLSLEAVWWAMKLRGSIGPARLPLDWQGIMEVRLIGEKLYEIDPEIQVCVLDYRPEFKRLGLIKPGYEEMVEIYKTLKEKGLKTVICQTEYGHLGPEL